MKTHVFDLDGVILASNGVKSDAFYKAALPYGLEAAGRMVAYHQNAGSISRRERWQHFFSDILGREPEDGELDQVIAVCTKHVAEGVSHAPKMAGLDAYLASITGVKMIVSGIEQTELEDIVALRNLNDFTYVFGGLPGVLKSERLTDLVLMGLIQPPAVYYGDTFDDYCAAMAAKLDFIFVAGNSEWAEGREFCRSQALPVIEDFREVGEKVVLL